MKITANKIYIAIIILLLIGNILPLIIFSEYICLTVFSIQPALIMLASIALAIITYDFRHQPMFDVFLPLAKYFKFYDFDKQPDITFSPEYQKEFAFCLFITCTIIPFHIPFIFFSPDVSHTLGSFYISFIPYIILYTKALIHYLKEHKKNKLDDERSLKEQERNESLGKWK